jgi:aspartate racemase
MKTVGIVGGIGPESTIAYYRLIVTLYRQQKRDGSYPSVIINSIDLNKMLTLIGANDLSALTDYLVEEVSALARAGAQCGLLAANTAHIVFDEIQRRSPIPLLSIVRTTCDAAKAQGLSRLGLFGTRSTMRGRFYPDVFAEEGMALIAPGEDDQGYIHDAYMSELVNGIVRPQTRERLLAIAAQLRQREHIDGLILGGTELTLILRDGMSPDIPFLDSAEIHAKCLVAELLS